MTGRGAARHGTAWRGEARPGAARQGLKKQMRSIPEWIGETADTPPPPRVRVRVFDDKGGRCHRCTRTIHPGDAWTCEHVIALINGGENRENNLDITCEWCLPVKNAEDISAKSRVYESRKRHLGIRKTRSFRTWRPRET
jgi:5-methylcytosine-specific restriction endonuclease McrA